MFSCLQVSEVIKSHSNTVKFQNLYQFGRIYFQLSFSNTYDVHIEIPEVKHCIVKCLYCIVTLAAKNAAYTPCLQPP